MRDIDQRVGAKPLIGLFHSLSSLVALRQAAAEDSFSALVLFDPPVCPPGGFPHDMEHIGQRMGEIARKRQNWFETPEHFAEQLSSKKVFERACPGGVDLFARTTLRRCADGRGYELRCPREYEAQINEYVFCWTMTVDIESVHCPIKAIGADPTVPHSYMPGMDLRKLLLVDYDFVPETTHFLQVEEPEVCAGPGGRIPRGAQTCLAGPIPKLMVNPRRVGIDRGVKILSSFFEPLSDALLNEFG